MRIVAFGAHGRTGLRLTRQALDAGHSVVAVSRRPAQFPITHPDLTIAGADVYDGAAVARVIAGAGADAVVSALGVPFGRKPVTIYSVGTANIAAGMRRHGVKRVVAISSAAVDPRPHADGGLFVNRLMQPLITRTIGRTTYADLRGMEAFLRGSGLDWTVVRPAGLFDADEVSAYRLDEDHADGVFTSRADLAACMLAQLETGAWIHRTVAVTTSAGTPTVWRMIRREAFARRRTFADPTGQEPA